MQLAADAATGRHVAVKFLLRDTLDASAVLREVQHQRACEGHPHIVQLLVRSPVALECSQAHSWLLAAVCNALCHGANLLACCATIADFV